MTPHPQGLTRERSTSQRLLARFRSSSRGEEHATSPDSIHASVANAGRLSVSVGSAFISHSLKVQHGAAAFLQELDRVVSQPQVPGRRRTGTLEVVDDAKSEKGVHPITRAETNPFEAQADGDATLPSPPQEKDHFDNFEEGGWIIHEQGKLFVRALLDTGSALNAIHLEKVLKTGLQIEPYDGLDILAADGPPIKPLGQIKLQFYFTETLSAKTWEIPFVVLRDPPFDVAFGRIFINQAKLIKRNTVMLPMEFRKLSPAEEAAKKAKTAQANQSSNEKQAAISSEYKNKKWATPSGSSGSKDLTKKK